MRTKTLTGILSSIALAGAVVLAGAGAAAAGQPTWSMTVDNLPSTVATGSDAGYQVTITNGGPSNIAKLSLGTDTTAPADYVTTTRGTCSDVGSPLSCTFGALRPGQSVVVVAAFPTPSDGTTSFDPGFFAVSNGSTQSDKGAQSHGDVLRDPDETATHLNDSPDFAGGFSIAGAPVNTNLILSQTNPQSTTVVPPSGGYVVTAQDGAGLSFACAPACDGYTPFGEWSSVNVDNGVVVGGLIKITLTVAQSQLPAGFGQADVPNVRVVHVFDPGHVPAQEVLSEQCGATPEAGCLTPTLLGSGDLQIVVYVDQNGGFKGML